MLAPRRFLATSGTAALAAAMGFAVPARAAPTISTRIPCVASLGLNGVMTLPLVGSGFSPNSLVRIRTSTRSKPAPKDLTAVRADASGSFRSNVAPPAFNSDDTLQESFNLLATDPANPTSTATAKFRQVRFGFDADPSTGRPSRRVTYTARGFLPGRTVYAHFRFGGKTRRNVKIGAATSPCGIVAKKMRLLPTKTRFGRWTVYMDQSPTYSKTTLLQAKGTLFIRRTLRRRG